MIKFERHGKVVWQIPNHIALLLVLLGFVLGWCSK